VFHHPRLTYSTWADHIAVDAVKERLVANLVASFAEVRDQAVVERCISHLRNADKDYGARVEKAVKALKAAK